jgi:hypothetical protein
MRMADMVSVYSGRRFSAQDIELIQQLTVDFPHLTRRELASTICELLGWHRPNGKPKTRECFAFLKQLAEKGSLRGLPTVRQAALPSARSVLIDTSSDPQPPVTGDLRDHLPVELRLVDNKLDPVHPSIPLSGLSHSLRRATALFCPFGGAVASAVGMSAVYQRGLEVGAA